VAGEDVLDERALRERVVKREVRPAGDAGEDANALTFEERDGELRSVHAVHVLFFLSFRGLSRDADREE
jgi:hypothetical protein